MLVLKVNKQKLVNALSAISNTGEEAVNINISATEIIFKSANTILTSSCPIIQFFVDGLTSSSFSLSNISKIIGIIKILNEVELNLQLDMRNLIIKSDNLEIKYDIIGLNTVSDELQIIDIKKT